MEKIGVAVLQHLPETIQTFSSQSRKTVSSLIQNIKADKTQVSSLIENIRSFDASINYSPSLALRYSRLNIEGVIEFFRDSSLRMNQFFSASSALSVALNSVASIYSSEIEKIEKDIFHLQNFVDNYQFIVGEDDLFNFNYVENFDNNLSSYLSDSQTIKLFDRDNVEFSSNGNYYIDPVLSKMTIANGINFQNQLLNIDRISSTSNYASHLTTDSDFRSVLDTDPVNNWTVTVKSPFLINSELPESKSYVNYNSFYNKGAQSFFEISFINPIEMDTIRVSPNDCIGMQLLQVVIEKTDPVNSALGNIEFSVLSSPLLIDKSVDVVFNKCNVSKIKFIFNQSKYYRSENVPITQELNSKMLQEIVDARRKEKSNSPSRLQDLVYFYFKNANDIEKNKNNRKAYTEVYSYRYPLLEEGYSDGVNEKLSELTESEILTKSREIVDSKNINAIENIVQTIVQHVIGARNNLFNTTVYRTGRPGNTNNRMASLKSDGFIPVKDEFDNFDNLFQKEDPIAPGVSVDSVARYLSNREDSNSYEYTFSIKNILFGLTQTSTQNKACFVSSKIETNGFPLGVKGIVNKVNARRDLTFNNYDIKESGSYELSITYKDSIESEDDWIPLFAGSSNYIESEVIFFDTFNLAKLRFIPQESRIKVYKNGILENPNNWEYEELGNSIFYKSTLDRTANYIVDYYLNTTEYSQSIIDIDSLSNSNFAVRAFSSGGNSGEKFISTGPGNKIPLSFIPYIEDRFNGAYYSETHGTINTESNIGYSPVTVTLADGQVAINLTNYTNNSFLKSSFYNTSQYLFFQNGKEIVFNRPINQVFTVNYSYIPSSLRFRLILRNNIPGQYNGISIDNVIIKSKVNNLDPFSKKLLRL